MKNFLSRFIFNMILFPAFYLLLLAGCGNSQMRNFNAIPPFSRHYVNAIIEIPAGTSKIIQYDEEKKMFMPVQSGESDQVVDFLPFPGNYGFVPGTWLDPVMGGDGMPVDILVISEGLPTGTQIEVIPVLVLYFDDSSDPGNIHSDPRIIAIPASERSRVLKAASYEELVNGYSDLVEILIKWFENYEGKGTLEIKTIGDDEVAVNEIRKWDIRSF